MNNVGEKDRRVRHYESQVKKEYETRQGSIMTYIRKDHN